MRSYGFGGRAAVITGVSLLGLLLIPRFWCPAAASVGRTATYAAIRTSQPPSDPGDLSDAVWKTGVVADGFIDVTTRRPAPLGTTGYVLYDAHHLYVGVRNEQPGVPITATQSTNDVGAGLDDADSVSIDTSGNGQRRYTFTVTPRGVRYEYSSESNRYAPRWEARTHVDGTTWTAELVIPFDALRAESREKQTWRINITRHVAAAQEDYSWAYDPAAQSVNDATTWPALTGIAIDARTLRPKPHADVYALASGGADRRSFETATGSFADQSPRIAGLDAVIPFTNTLAFVGTLAPDFSNLENDQTTIAPQQYRLAYTEYRPFFAQGARYLDPFPAISINTIQETPFYTPGIGTFQRGYKIEGVAGHSSIGVLDVAGAGFDDQAFGYELTNSAKTLSVGAQGVLAHHADGHDSTLGAAITQHDPRNGESLFAAFDTERGTFVTDPALARRVMAGGTIATQRVTIAAAWKSIGPQYNPVDGYTPINDIRGPLLLAQLNETANGGAVKSWSIVGYGDRYLDGSGAVHETTAIGQVSVTFRNLLSVQLGTQNATQRIYDVPHPVYANPQDLHFEQSSIALGYRDGTPSPLDASYGAGPFAIQCVGLPSVPSFCAGATTPFVQAFLQQLTLSGSRSLGRSYAVSAELDTTRERPPSGAADSQQLRKVSLTRSFGRDASFALGLRTISGTGGYGVPGTNVAASFHQRFRNQSELYVEYGTPAAYRTLQRMLVKYVFHVGGGAGT
ncbi:MAG: hypothetical protein QOJ39_956 [Candidatus Eremiobacteraeota bacterium]|nr:hypothetical protein [Candidatus Eremiobacteraeota bacterium]